MKALKSGDTARARQLISQGANVNGKDENGGTPLYYQVAKATSIRDKKPEYDELVRLMLDRDSPLTPTDYDGKLAFFAGAAFGQTAILEKLLKSRGGR